MLAKRHKTRFADDLSYWYVEKCLNNNEVENVDDEERSIALSVKILLKSQKNSSYNHARLPSHVVHSPKCQCHRSFHIFCTDLFDENHSDTAMIHTRPAPHWHDRDLSRRISTPYRKNRYGTHEENVQDTMVTTRLERHHVAAPESHSLEKKFRIPSKVPSRTSPLHIPTPNHSMPTPIKYFPSIHTPRPITSLPQLQVRALSVVDSTPSRSNVFFPRTPPPSPKTPIQEPAITSAPLQAISITPRLRKLDDQQKKLTSTKIANYADSVRDYLSAADYSDQTVDKDINQRLSIIKAQLSARTQSVSRPATALSVRLLSHIANRYLSVAKSFDSSSDVQKTHAEKTRRIFRAQTRSTTSVNENNDTTTTVTKSGSIPKSKSVFGFSKTASSMHFGYAADRLSLQGSFEKWPRPQSRRTPIERKHEVTTLRLVTLPLVTS